MASMCGYQLPWDADLIEEEFTDINDYFLFKSNVTDQQIIDLLPSWLIKPFKYIMRLKDDQTPSYEKLKLCLHSVDESPWGGIDSASGRVNMENSKIYPLHLLKWASTGDDSVADDFTQANPDDSCHAYDITAYNFSQLPNGAGWPIMNNGELANSKPDISFGSKVELLQKPPMKKQESSVNEIEEDDSDDNDFFTKGKENVSNK